MRIFAGGIVALLVLSSAVQAQQPNVLLIFSDDVGYGDVGPFKFSTSPIATPNIDQLAAEGMVFSDAHTTASVCAPSRYSILTGNYPFRGRHDIGVWHFNDETNFLPGQLTLGDVFQSQGYQTAFIGKMHLGGDFYRKGSNSFYRGEDFTQVDFTRPFSNGPNDHGFDYSYVVTNGVQASVYAYFENGMHVPIDPAQPDIVWLPAGPLNGGTLINDGVGDPNWDSRQAGPNLVTSATSFIDAHVAEYGTDAPFFMYYSTQAIHVPVTPPDFLNGTQIAGFTGIDKKADMIHELDVQVGALMAVLESHGIADNTLVIFTSDNGGVADASHREIGHDSNAGLRGRKATIYEGGHRVPFIVRWTGDSPGSPIVEPGSQSDQLVSVQDVMATVYDVLGIPVPDGQGQDSVSFLPVLTGQQPAEVAVRDELLVRSGHWDMNAGWHSFRKNGLELILDKQLVPVELYDLPNDSLQSINLIDDPAYKDARDDLLAGVNELLNPSQPPVVPGICEEPTIDSAADHAVFVWKDCNTGEWFLRVHAGNGFTRYFGTLDSSTGFAAIKPYKVENSDVLDTTTNWDSISFMFELVPPWSDGVDFTPSNGGSLCFTIDEPAAGGATILVGSNRISATSPFNPETLGPCESGPAVLSIADVSVLESAGQASFDVRLSEPQSVSVSVDYRTTDGTAFAGEDYLAAEETLVFAPGETSIAIDISILDDLEAEGSEYFDVQLSNSTGAEIAVSAATATIQDDELVRCGMPAYDSSIDHAAVIWKDCGSDEWRARFAAADGYEFYVGSVIGDQPVETTAGYRLEKNDSVENTQDLFGVTFSLYMVSPWDDGFDFKFPQGTSMCFDLLQPGNPTVLLGPDRTPVSVPFNPETGAPCQ